VPKLLYRTTIPKPDDPDIIARVAQATELGHPLDTAGQLAGLGHSVAGYWYRQGTAQLDQADALPPPDAPPEAYAELGSHAAFAAAVKLAEARMVEQQLQHVARDAALPGKGWTAAMTLLERRRPQDFARRTNVAVEQQTTVTYVIDLSPEAAAALASAQHQLALPSPNTVDGTSRRTGDAPQVTELDT